MLAEIYVQVFVEQEVVLSDKKLIMENKKLRGIIKTGVDALKEEQDMVKNLKQRLASKQVNKGGTRW